MTEYSKIYKKKEGTKKQTTQKNFLKSKYKKRQAFSPLFAEQL